MYVQDILRFYYGVLSVCGFVINTSFFFLFFFFFETRCKNYILQQRWWRE